MFSLTLPASTKCSTVAMQYIVELPCKINRMLDLLPYIVVLSSCLRYCETIFARFED